jgi:hypothetical protein
LQQLILDATLQTRPPARVRVKARQLRQPYATLDQLVAQQKQIERELFLRLRKLFSSSIDLAFCDLTSTYFEGNGPAGFAGHGHSRVGKARNRQVLVGDDDRRMADRPSPLPWQLARFEHGEEHVGGPARAIRSAGLVLVGDRGMVTSDNLDLLRTSGQG